MSRKSLSLYNKGTSALMDGRLDTAIMLLGKAARQSNDTSLQSQAWGNLGVAFRRTGQLHEAKDAFESALKADPNDTGARFNLGNTLRALGSHEEALVAYNQIDKTEPDRADVANNRGAALMALGRVAEAEVQFQRAVQINPEFGPAWGNLGAAQAALGKKAAPLRSLQRASRLEPEHPGILIKLGNLLIERGHLNAADRAFRQALRHAPQELNAKTGLAQVLHRLGKNDEAMALLQPLIDANQISPNLAVIFTQICKRQGRSEEAITLLERMLSAPCNTSEQVLLHYSLGDALDKCGRWNDAFASWSKANQLRNLQYEERFVKEFVAHVEQLFSSFENVNRSSSQSEAPIFIVGMPRSGTSLVEQILAAHPGVHGAGEREEIRQLAEVARQHGPPGSLVGCVPDLSTEILDRLVEIYWSRVTREVEPFERITDKMPQNFLFLGLIAMLFPRARIIRCRRDPVDTGLSCFTQNFKDTLSWATSVEGIASYISAERRLMEHWHKVLPLPILDVDYEKLVTQPEQGARRIIDFAGLDWDDACLSFHTSKRIVTTASYAQVKQPIYTSSVGRSKAYEVHLQQLAELRSFDALGS